MTSSVVSDDKLTSQRPVLQCVERNNALHQREHQNVCTNFGGPRCEVRVHLQRETVTFVWSMHFV